MADFIAGNSLIGKFSFQFQEMSVSLGGKWRSIHALHPKSDFLRRRFTPAAAFFRYNAKRSLVQNALSIKFVGRSTKSRRLNRSNWFVRRRCHRHIVDRKEMRHLSGGLFSCMSATVSSGR